MKNDNPVKQTLCHSRRFVLTSGVLGTAITASGWSKPIVSSVILPAHAATSEIMVAIETTITPATTAAAGAEIFFQTFSGFSGLLGDLSQIRVLRDNGVYTVEFYSDGADTDLGGFIQRGSSNALGSVNMTTSGCGNDGSETPSSQVGILTLSNYVPGVSIDVGNGLQTLSIPLSPGAISLACPIL